MKQVFDIFTRLGGEFICDPDDFAARLRWIKAFVFDWDGVFNAGAKGENLHSSFTEPDSMGLNMLRFGYWLRNERRLPPTAIITGADNRSARLFAQREHLHAVYSGFTHKVESLKHFAAQHQLSMGEIAFCFDDILDVSAAQECGLRLLVRRHSSPLFMDYMRREQLCDYISAAPGSKYAVRENSELLLGVYGNFEEVLRERIAYSQAYTAYLERRNLVEPEYFGNQGQQLPG